jgi:processing peptidase subunit alpha
LENGITVVSESSTIPSTVTFKILLDVGSRHETHDTSGSLHSIKSTYLKTVMNTNETVNYGMVQMSGGWSSMRYDQETAIFSASCIAHDAVDIFGMLADCALEPRSVVSANVSMKKMKHHHYLEQILGTGKDLNDNLFATAYGLKGLGMPLLGLESNIEYLNAQKIQKFQLSNITPKRIYIGGSGVDNHEEFVELVREKLRYITPIEGRKVKEVAPSEYIGGSNINMNPSSHANIALAFEAPSWKDKEAVALRLAAYILGSTANSHNDHNHVHNYDRIYRNLTSSKAYIDKAQAFNYTFSDSGLFGLRVSGSASHVSSPHSGQEHVRRHQERA